MAYNPWMASVAQDKKGDIAVGVTVSNGIPVFPGVCYTGRLKADELNHLPTASSASPP
jgi:hypothetical protein